MAIGPWQIVVIVLLILLVFGASRLSEIGKGLGEGIRQFKKGVSGDEPAPKKKRRRDEEEDEADEDEEDEGEDDEGEDDEGEDDEADEEAEQPKRLSSRSRDREEGTRERRHVRPKRPKTSGDEE